MVNRPVSANDVTGSTEWIFIFETRSPYSTSKLQGQVRRIPERTEEKLEEVTQAPDWLEWSQGNKMIMCGEEGQR